MRQAIYVQMLGYNARPLCYPEIVRVLKQPDQWVAGNPETVGALRLFGVISVIVNQQNQ
jgi:hypothetical protein